MIAVSYRVNRRCKAPNREAKAPKGECDTMTKKDYEKAADIVMRLPSNTKATRATAETVCESFVKFFADDNPRFDASRFREACKN